VAHTLQLFIQTNRFKPESPQYYGSDCVNIAVGTCDTIKLNEMTQNTLTRIFKTGFEYKKCGVILGGIETSSKQVQMDWLNPVDSDQRMRLMDCMDHLSERFGRSVIQFGTASGNNDWLMRRDKLSPCFTTNIEDVLKVN
jgi:DNA polymerase V